jgi:hypothetical protein
MGAVSIEIISQNAKLISEIANDKKFKEALNQLNAKFLKVKPQTLTARGITEEEKQKQLAESYNKQIDEYLKTLDAFTPQSKQRLDKQMNYATISAGLLPLFLTLISGGLFVISDSLLSFITNAFSVIPPLFLNSIKGKIDGYFKGAKLKAALNDMKYNIERLATLGELTGEVRKTLDEQLKQIAEDFSKL